MTHTFDFATSRRARAPAAIITSAQQALDTAAQLAEMFARESAERDRERRLPLAELDLFSQSGLWAITVPRAYGGADVSSATLTRVIDLISAADGSLGQIPQNHFYALEVLRVHGSPAQQDFFFRRVLAGDRLGNALAERSTRIAADRTMQLEPLDDAHYVLNGRKFYATGAYYADWIPTALGDANGNQWLAFAARDAAGLTVIDDWSGFGQRTTASGTVQFEQVKVPREHVVLLHQKNAPRTTIKPFAQILHAAIDLGIARGAYQNALSFVAQHTRPWIESNQERATDDPLTLSEFGKLSVRLEAADALVERAATLLDQARQPQPGPAQAALAELAAVAVAEARALTTEISLSASSKLLELSGTRATSSDLGLDRYWRNARVHTLHDPVRWKEAAVGQFYLHGRLPTVTATT